MSFDIERFDIEQMESAKGLGSVMDAVTSFELEAQRRREVLGIDRGNRWKRTEPMEAEPTMVHVPSSPRMAQLPTRLAPAGDCRPAQTVR